MNQTKEKKNIIVSFIKSLSDDGETLLKDFKEWISEYIRLKSSEDNLLYELLFYDIVGELAAVKESPTLADCQFLSLLTLLHSDLVVFDGSIENNDFHQYRFAYETMKQLDYALIVSRTELPYNYEGRRRGGAPSWIKIGEPSACSDSGDDMVCSNSRILSWLQCTIPQLELPRPDRFDGTLDLQNSVSAIVSMIDHSDERMSRMEKEKPSLFISYLSRHYPTMKQFFPEISAKTGIPISQFSYFAPGKVAKELMSERRRWEIVSVTDRVIAQNSVFVIFETEGYRKSWWTTGEIMSIAYRYRHNWHDCPTVYIARLLRDDCGEESIQWTKLDTPEEKQTYFPEISEEQMRRLARRFVSSDLNEAAYELDEKMVRQSAQPAWMKRMRAAGKGILLYALENSGALDIFTDSEKLSCNEETNTFSLKDSIARANESEFSYTHTNDYLTKRILECPYCRELSSDLTIDNFIELDMPHVYRIDDQEIQHDADGDLSVYSKCPEHRGRMQLQKSLSYPRFIQPRRGKQMEKNKILLELVDRIEIT